MMSDITTSTDAIMHTTSMHEPPTNVFVFPFSTSAEYYLSKTADGTEQVREKTLDESATTDQSGLLAVPGSDRFKAIQFKTARKPAESHKMVRLFPDQAVSQSPTDVVSFPTPTKLASTTNKLQQVDVDMDMDMEEDIEISLHDDNGLHVPPTGAHPSLQRLPPHNLSITAPPTRHSTAHFISSTGARVREYDLPMSYDASICHVQRERLDSDKVRPRLLRLEIDSESKSKSKSKSKPTDDDELLPFTPGSPDKMKGWAEQVLTPLGPLSPEPFVLEGLAQEIFTPLGPFSPTSSETKFQLLGCNTGPEHISPYTPFSALVTPPRRETDLWPVMSDEADDGIQESSSDGTGQGSSDGVGIGQASSGEDDEGRISASLAGILGRTGIEAQKVRYSTL